MLLSHIVTARNDDYLGGFVGRLEMTINYNCGQIMATGGQDDYELLIVDWNSPTPLRTALNLNPAALKLTSFLEAPPRIAVKYGLDGRPFQPGVAVNVGIRRARGRIIMLTAADVLFAGRSVADLLALLKGETPFPADLDNCYLGVERFLVPWVRAERLRPEELDRYLLLHTTYMVRDEQFHGLCGSEGSSIVSRKILHEIRGLNEGYAQHGYHDIELGRRVAQFAPQLKATAAGIFFHDLSQRPRVRSSDLKANVDLVKISPVDNDENWGLGQEEIPFQPAEPHPEINREPARPRPYDQEALLEINPLRPSKLITLERAALGHSKDPLVWAGRLLGQARSGRRRSIFSRLGFEALLAHLEREAAKGDDEIFFGPWFGDRAELFGYLRAAMDRGAYRFISRWNLALAYSFLAALATVGRRRPDRFFQAGLRDFHLAQAAAAVDRTIEISAYDHWRPELYPHGHVGEKLFPITRLDSLMAEIGYQGYFHVETGPMKTALERLKLTPLAGEPFQAAFLDLDFLAPVGDNLAGELRPLLDEAPALVLRGAEERLTRMREELKPQGLRTVGRLPGLEIMAAIE